jgi:hypothetical protein
MTFKQSTLLNLAEYVAITGGILLATSGRFKLLAVPIPLALVGPFWIADLVRWRRGRRANDATLNRVPHNEEL